jgi:transcriptional regulator with XRE-family HTH domain
MFWKIFLELCVGNNISPNALAKELKISSGAVTKWKDGSVPHHSTLLKIANYFNVTVEYLLGETDTKTPPADADDETVSEFGELMGSLSADERKELMNYARFLMQKRKE